MTDPRQAWTSFWTDAGRASQACLPDAPGIDRALRAAWRDFAGTLRKGARVLDLATGDGTVLARMAGARPDLKLTGVDYAAALPPAPRGVKLKSGVSIEALPFADGSFDAVTSQFGIEYADQQRSVAELARVLGGGGRFQLVVHNHSSPVLGHNRARAVALRWAARDSGYLTRANQFARLGSSSGLPIPPLFRAAPNEARAAFPGQPVAAEFVTAILQSLELGRRGPPEQTVNALSVLAAKAEHELARIAALEAAALDTVGVTGLAAALTDAGLAVDAPATLDDPDSRRPFAWVIAGRSPAKP
ncbi:methyltransferase domain-containing protein [Sphingosinicella sp. YJ22]|uniref:methyltransferase domain-containing protein n=1 Tax=Sphingosinicella sp. YJ22 TaxID=1104780 RepID=UPI0014097F3C|nr:methyltransferase domain-containing protein [Sphingosinicella sp. YJ22]